MPFGSPSSSFIVSVIHFQILKKKNKRFHPLSSLLAFVLPLKSCSFFKPFFDKKMATQYPGAVQVGSYFVGQYYQVLQQHPDLVHQFYGDQSSMIRVDGDSTNSASNIHHIHTLLTSLNFSAIEIKTINSLDSLLGGVLVMVSGSVKTKDISGSRKFVQTFFLAPQDKGYYVLNDIFQYVEDEIIYKQHPAPLSSGNVYQQHQIPMSSENMYQQHQVPISSENMYQQHQVPMSSENLYPQHPASMSSEDTFETKLNASSPLPEPPEVSNYVLEEESRDYVNPVHLEDDPISNYGLQEHNQQQEFENEIDEEDIPVDEFQDSLHIVQDPLHSTLEEPVEEAPKTKKSYAAAILQGAKEQFSSSVAIQPSVNRSTPATSDWNHTPSSNAQQYQSGLSSTHESGVEAAEQSFSFDEGESKSVYVRNLPSNVTAAEIKQEFKGFGRIKPDGVVIKNRKDVPGVYYAFVEFEDLLGVQNAIKASPIQLAGRQIYVEERRPNTGTASRGRGRGRGGYQADASRGRFTARATGRGNDDEGGDFNRLRGNGFYQRGSR